VYDFIEFVSIPWARKKSEATFVDACNHYSGEREFGLSVRMLAKLSRLVLPTRVDEIENAIERSTPYYGVKQHLSKAIALLSDKKNPRL
jgi:hypothetical protein